MAVAGADILAQKPQTPPAAPPAATKTAAKDAPKDGAIRKLTRRERKDRMAKLPEKYRQFLEEVEPIMQPSELDTFLLLETDAQREIYLNDFWRRRDLASGTTRMAFRENYYVRLEYAREQYKQLSSDRSRMFLIHGEPQETLKIDCHTLLQPLELWKYNFIPGLGHAVWLVFYMPRLERDFRLWRPSMNADMSLAELISQDGAAFATDDKSMVDKVFRESAMGGAFYSKIQAECANGDTILRAIQSAMMNKTELTRVFEPPQVNEEDVTKILRSVDLATPTAPKLSAEFAVRYPGKQGARTDAEMTVLVPRSQLTQKDVGGTSVYSIDVTGEVLREGQLYENFRYR
ncbi:MAG TPA: GWxTD domain-containing protein, partial [Thermoanaerobaculia bacterium]